MVHIDTEIRWFGEHRLVDVGGECRHDCRHTPTVVGYCPGLWVEDCAACGCRAMHEITGRPVWRHVTGSRP